MQAWFCGLLVLALLGGIVSGLPVFVVLLGVPLAVAGLGTLVGAFDPGYLAAFPQRVFGLAGNTLLVAVPLFVLMGLLLERSRTAERMLVVMAHLLGGSRRGLVLAVLIVSALIAASTGIIGATIVMLGLISLPAMRRAGVPVRLASGLVCASGTLGQIIPPSIVLILLGDQISTTYLQAQHAAGNFAPEPVSVADLFAGALLPGLLLVLLYGAYALARLWLDDRRDFPVGTGVVKNEAGRPDPFAGTAGGQGVASAGSAEVDADTTGSLWATFVPPMLLIGSVLGSILLGVATPTEAAAIGAGGALLLAASQLGDERFAGAAHVAVIATGAALALVVLRNLAPQGAGAALRTGVPLVLLLAIALGLLGSAAVLQRRRLLVPVLLDTVQITGMIFGIVIGASMLSLVFRGFGGDELVSTALEALPGGDHTLLLAVLLLIFVLGFLLEFVEIIFIVVPLIGPTLLASGFDPVWLGILIAMNLQTSFLTPPFGFALFYFRSVAPPGLSTLGLYRAVLPFVALQVLALCCVYAFPPLATWLPGLID